MYLFIVWPAISIRTLKLGRIKDNWKYYLFYALLK